MAETIGEHGGRVETCHRLTSASCAFLCVRISRTEREVCVKRGHTGNRKRRNKQGSDECESSPFKAEGALSLRRAYIHSHVPCTSRRACDVYAFIYSGGFSNRRQHKTTKGLDEMRRSRPGSGWPTHCPSMGTREMRRTEVSGRTGLVRVSRPRPGRRAAREILTSRQCLLSDTHRECEDGAASRCATSTRPNEARYCEGRACDE